MVMNGEDLIGDPSARLRALLHDGGTVPKVNENVPLVRYYRSLNEMYRMACVYRDENNFEAALKLYIRFSTLLLEHLPMHPAYRYDNSKEKTNAGLKLRNAIDQAETLKKRLRERYQIDADAFMKEQEQRLAEIKEKEIQERSKPPSAPPLPFPSDVGSSSTSNTSPSSGFPIVDIHSIEYPDLDLTPPSIAATSLPSFETPSAPSVPSIDRSTKPNAASIGQTYLPTNIYGYRSMVIPRGVVMQFMNAAASNTAQNTETCGILCGRLTQNKFVVTHIVVPKQTGTPDSCTTEDEVQVFDFQDNHDLITLGWIHTHPTQTAFLSSVDLHTHCSYQIMLPEAVAVVCSPKYHETGVFMLTESGMRQIESCREKGFHPHQQEPPLFESCPHAILADGVAGTLTDLR